MSGRKPKRQKTVTVQNAGRGDVAPTSATVWELRQSPGVFQEANHAR